MSENEYKQKYVCSCPEDFKLVFDYVSNLSSEYLQQTSITGGVMIKNGAFFQTNFQSKYLNVTDGFRHTSDTPELSEQTIFLLGPSYVFGSYCEDNGTIASHLQKLCNEKIPGKYSIRNYGLQGNTLEFYRFQIRALPIAKNDLVVLISHIATYQKHRIAHWKFIDELNRICNDKMCHFCFFLYPRLRNIVNPSRLERKYLSNSFENLYKGTTAPSDAVFPEKYSIPDIIKRLTSRSCRCFDLQPCIERPHSQGEIFIDKGHLCAKGYKLIAEYVYECFVGNMNNIDVCENEVEDVAYNSLINFTHHKYRNNKLIHEFIAKILSGGFSVDKGCKIGAIVMNCNPFTLGHKFLIEQALAEVECLYLFLVEEDRSDFALCDRLEMVRAGVAHLEGRVKVFPSGKFIISSFTFPEYFIKTDLTNVPIDSTADILIFGAVIAPYLNISIRFVGEEPYCNVTKQYNETMKKILPHAGVKVHEIARHACNNIPISASLVRQYIKEGNFTGLKTLVPSTTLNVLKKLYPHQIP